MSYDEHLREKKSKKRGASNPTRSLDGLGQAEGQPGGASYDQADGGLLFGIIIQISKRGGAVSFGLSRDKGAYNVTIFLDGDRRTVWINGSEDLNAKLEEIFHVLLAMPD
jgi:hypothetical protein